MAKKPRPAQQEPPATEPVEQLNALIPVDLKRRAKIAAVNQGKTLTALLIEWMEAGLAKSEK